MSDRWRRGSLRTTRATMWQLNGRGESAQTAPPPPVAAPGDAHEFPLPDLLSAAPDDGVDHQLLGEILDLAFLGRESRSELDNALGESPLAPSRWDAELFASDLYLRDFVAGCLRIQRGEHRIHVQTRFLERVLASPPTDLETIRFRQAILRELEEDDQLRSRTEGLYDGLHHLLQLFRAARSDARLNHTYFRLEILGHARQLVDRMDLDFAEAASGLRRLHLAARDIKTSEAYGLLTSVLDYDDRSAFIDVELRVGANGRARGLRLRGIRESTGNRFHRGPWQRWLDLLRLAWHRHTLDTQVIVDGVVFQVWIAIAPAVRSLLQVIGHLEVYLASLGFAEEARRRGLEVSLAELGRGTCMELSELFNPLLLRAAGDPVPCSVAVRGGRGVAVVSGPNSGGKTRLLQAVGLAQVLGQSGLYTPCARATLPVFDGLFASLEHRAGADQPEGRLGTELLRIRTLFESAPRRSLILLDELCSGTNPSEATEIVTMVLQLLDRLEPVAFITTHYLDFVARLAERPPIRDLVFLQVEAGADGWPTYRFVPGVATTSMAASTAHRLGVTFDQLAALAESRYRSSAESAALSGGAPSS